MRPIARLTLALFLLSIRVAPAASQERALAPLEVRLSPAFQTAVEGGTRTLTGLFADVDESDDLWTP